MSKLRDQYSTNDRLREYIERMLTVIIENNPQLLEVTTSSGVSIGSMGMSSGTPTEYKSVAPDIVLSNESTKSESSSPTAAVKEPADKYCRL